jgi:replicative superfamily II helicase
LRAYVRRSCAHFGSRLETHESFEMLCWRRMEKISWTDNMRNEEILQRVKEERNILQTIKRMKANWIGHILHRNCLIKHTSKEKCGKDRRDEKTRKKT